MEDLAFFVLYNIFEGSKKRQKPATNPRMNQKRCQGRRACTAGGTTRPGEGLPGLKGGTPPATSQECFLGLVPPRNLFFPMPNFAFIFDGILATVLLPKAPTLEPKTNQNASQNRSQNYYRKLQGSHENMQECKVLKPQKSYSRVGDVCIYQKAIKI